MRAKEIMKTLDVMEKKNVRVEESMGNWTNWGKFLKLLQSNKMKTTY
jgi:hypothetical protein